MARYTVRPSGGRVDMAEEVWRAAQRLERFSAARLVAESQGKPSTVQRHLRALVKDGKVRKASAGREPIYELAMPVPRLALTEEMFTPVIETRCVDTWRAAREYPRRLYDLILTDAPYPTLERHRAAGGSTVRLKKWFKTHSHQQILWALGRLGHMLRPGAFALVMADWSSALELAMRDGVSFVGLAGSAAPLGSVTELWWRTPWVWEKTSLSGEPFPGMGYYGRGAFELVLVLQRPGPTSPATADVLRRTCNVVRAAKVSRASWPTEKPVDLAQQLIRSFAPSGRWVLDPWAGSGWAGLAALAEGKCAELWDEDPEAPAVAREDWPESAKLVRVA